MVVAFAKDGIRNLKMLAHYFWIFKLIFSEGKLTLQVSM